MFKFNDRKKLIYLGVIFLVLIIPVIGIGEYQRFKILKDLDWGIKGKEIQGESSPDIGFSWLPEQTKIVLDFPIVVENPADMDAVFSRLTFDISVWGLDRGGGEISQRHIIPARGSKTLWIKNFEVNARDFENYVFTVSRGDRTNVDIDISITTFYPLFNIEVEGGHASLKVEYLLDKDDVDMVVQKKLEPLLSG